VITRGTKSVTHLDIRWEQRFANYRKALAQMQCFIDKKDLSNLEKQGLIKSFEYTYELAWNTMKDFLEFKGQTDIFGSRDAIRIAFSTGLITEGEDWMDMLKNRNATSHTYNEEVAEEIAQAILTVYFRLFVQLKAKFESLRSAPDQTIFDRE
jgi:nucleotidyltransferase substrate binding protein (TIGR01987 family)